MQGHREHTLGYGSGSTPGRDHDRDASCRGRRKIDVIDTDTSACDDAQPGSAREERGIDDGVGTDDRADSIGSLLFAWIGDERYFISEDASDQLWIYGPKRHNHRTVESHDLTHVL
jgi:hypothetical protein